MAAPKKFVDEWKLRRMFRQGDFLAKLNRGELTERILRANHPSPPLSFEPYCTQSQMVAYDDAKGKTVAIVHQYLRPNGTIGASGKPDPKFLFYKGTKYHFKLKPKGKS